MRIEWMKYGDKLRDVLLALRSPKFSIFNSQCSCKESAMPNLFEHCRAAAELHSVAVIFNLIAIGLLQTSCSSQNEFFVEEITRSSVNKDFMVPFGLSFGQESVASTRQTGAATQAAGTFQSFRGINELTLIPFNVTGANNPVRATDQSLRTLLPLTATYINTLNADNTSIFDHSSSNLRSLLFKNVFVPVSTASFLVYGHEPSGGEGATPDNKFAYGSTIKRGFESDYSSYSQNGVIAGNIEFHPDSISVYPYADYAAAKAIADEIATYLTGVATYSYNNTLWKNTTNNNKNRFNDFTFNGYSFTLTTSSLATMLETVYEGTWDNNTNWRNPIRTRITNDSHVTYANNTISISGTWLNFPTMGNLPQHLFVFKWINDENRFKVLETGTTDAPEIGFTIANKAQMAYPAQLWYYANTPIKVIRRDSGIDTDAIEAIYTGKSYWDGSAAANTTSNTVLKNFTDGAVTQNVGAMALVDPLNYGIARLALKFQSNATTLRDGANTSFSTGTSSAIFPLTGVFVGSQHPQLYNFTPKTITESHIVYDKTLNGTYYIRSGTAQGPNHTLVLPTNAGEVVYITLEFTNSSGNTIVGVNNCRIPAGNKFYLVGKLDAEDVSAATTPVFEADHVTTVTAQVQGLSGAYAAVPDVASPMLVLSLEVDLDWQQATPHSSMLK